MCNTYMYSAEEAEMLHGVRLEQARINLLHVRLLYDMNMHYCSTLSNNITTRECSLPKLHAHVAVKLTVYMYIHAHSP